MLFLLVRVFRANNIDYVNSVHGVGFYCRRTDYSEFRYLTESQREFYCRSSPQTRFCRRQTANFEMLGKRSVGDSKGAIVYVHQDFHQSGLLAEADVEHRILVQLDALKLPDGMEKIVKVHPNSDPSALHAKIQTCRVVRDWNDLGGRSKTFSSDQFDCLL